MAEAILTQGSLHYRESGSGAPVVFLHGYLQDGRLWDPVVERLRGEFRCITPDLPMGAHRAPLSSEADLSPAGLGRLVADLLDALDLTDVTLVGNDTGGAIAQVVAARHAERLGRLVLTSCDAFDNLPPRIFQGLIPLAKAGLLTPLFALMKVRRLRALPFALGWLTNSPLPHELVDDWSGAYFADKGVRRDTRRMTAALRDVRFMMGIADELAAFAKPALVAWAGADKLFPFQHAERLASILPDARLETIEDSRTWVMRDQPERTAELIRDFVRATEPRERYSIASGGDR